MRHLRRVALISRSHTRECFSFNQSINHSSFWMTILKGDVLNYQRLLEKKFRPLSNYDLVLIELVPKLYNLPQLVKVSFPELFIIGLIEGRMEPLIKTDPEMEAYLEFYKSVDAIDMLGVLHEEAALYYKLLPIKPEKVQFIGIPYPLRWANDIVKPPPRQKNLRIQLGSGILSRNGITNLLIFKKLKSKYPEISGVVPVFTKREADVVKQIATVECFTPLDWQAYFKNLVNSFAILCMDERRTWGRFAMDAAAAKVPFIGSHASEGGQQVGILTCDPYDVEQAHDYLDRLISEATRKNYNYYEKVTREQYKNLKNFASEERSLKRFWKAVEKAKDVTQ